MALHEDVKNQLSQMNRRMLGILAISLLLRLLIVWFVIETFPPRWFFTHGVELGTLAQSICDGRGLSSPFFIPTGPTALLAPGYPLLIALLFRVFGSLTFGASLAVMALQTAFNVGTVLLILRIGEVCFSRQAAERAGLFWAVSLPLLWMPTIFWETCLSALLLAGMVGLALRCARSPSKYLYAWMGAFSGLAVLVNPALLVPVLALLGWSAWQTRKIALLSPWLGLIIFLAVMAPWVMRNGRALHAFVPLRSTVGFELWVGNREGADGYLDESAFPLFNRGELNAYVENGEIAYMQQKASLAKAYIAAQPLVFLQLSARRFFRFWTGTGNRSGSIVYALHAVLTTVLGSAGLCRLFIQRRFRLASLFLLPLLTFPLPYYITHAEFRYRLVIDPLLTILGGYALSGSPGWTARI